MPESRRDPGQPRPRRCGTTGSTRYEVPNRGFLGVPNPLAAVASSARFAEETVGEFPMAFDLLRLLRENLRVRKERPGGDAHIGAGVGDATIAQHAACSYSDRATPWRRNPGGQEEIDMALAVDAREARNLAVRFGDGTPSPDNRAAHAARSAGRCPCGDLGRGVVAAGDLSHRAFKHVDDSVEFAGRSRAGLRSSAAREGMWFLRCRRSCQCARSMRQSPHHGSRREGRSIAGQG